MALATIWIPCNNFFPGRNGYKAKWLILHGTASNTAPNPAPSAQNIAVFFKSTENTNEPVSSHYIIGTDGTIVQTVREADGAFANGFLSNGHDSWWSDAVNPNYLTISIEHCKSSSDNSDALTLPQQQASFALIADICARNGIPCRGADESGGITGHYSIDPVNRSRCPGTYPWDLLWSFLKGDMNHMGVPTGWTDDGSTLTAPNGIGVRTGFRDYILNHAWDPGNWPLQPEQGLTPLEISNPALGGGTQLVCRWTTLEWTDKTGVFVAWSGQELLAMRNLATNYVNQIKSLQAQLAQASQAGNTAQVADLKNRLSQIHTLSTLS